jgi:hypothetical protein
LKFDLTFGIISSNDKWQMANGKLGVTMENLVEDKSFEFAVRIVNLLYSIIRTSKSNQ